MSTEKSLKRTGAAEMQRQSSTDLRHPSGDARKRCDARPATFGGSECPTIRESTTLSAAVVRRGGTGLIIAILVGVVLTSAAYDMWGIFHYYLGAKYFSELGYFDLYSCGLQAHREAGASDRDHAPRVRDLRTYNLVLPSQLPPCPRGNFTPERWSEFSTDFQDIASLAPSYVAYAFADKGFNPPPFWVAISKPFVWAVDAFHGRLNILIFNMDIAASLIAIIIIWRSSGSAAAILTAALTVFYFGNFTRLGGNLLQYLWYPFLVAAVALWRKGNPAVSGTMLGVAVGLQAFPIFFGIPVVIHGLANVIRKRPREEWRPHLLFVIALGSTTLACFAVGSLAGRGLDAWKEWHSKLLLHRTYLDGEIFNIGLPNLAATIAGGHTADAKSYEDDNSNTLVRLESLRRNAGVLRVSSIAVLLLIVIATAMSSSEEVLGYGAIVMYAIVSSSPYYYLALVLLPFMFWNSQQLVRSYAIYGTVILVIGHTVVFRTHYVSFDYVPHLCSELSIAVMLIGLPLILIYGRLAKRIKPPAAT